MLLVIDNVTVGMWHVNDYVEPLEYYGEIVMVIDPSKTNMAVLISTPDGAVIRALEFSGNNRRRGPVDDTTIYCHEVRNFIQRYLVNCKLKLAAVEQAITPKNQTHHRSNMVLTEIRANILNFFLEVYNVRCLEINNWSWKFAVLPEGYRSQSEKGSKRYFVENFPDSPFSKYFEADITDCLCMLKYVVDKFCKNYVLYCMQVESCTIPYTYICTREDLPTPTMQEVAYNPGYTVTQNLDFYTNRIIGPYTMLVDADSLSIDEIYGHSQLYPWQSIEDGKVKVVASRK